jgi:cation transport protein ChaC
MRKSARQMALTPDLVARVHRVVEDPGPDPSFVNYTDEEYETAVQTILASHSPGRDAWLFAYGSLIWKPAIDQLEERMGRAHGWHRSFGLKMTRWRGTKEQPGLMMGLDRGGQCNGVLLRLPTKMLEVQLAKLLRREMPLRPAGAPPTNIPRWISVETEQGRVRAIAFVLNRKGVNYVGRLALDKVASILAEACGHGGSCAEYLFNTVSHLEAHGIHDRNLWRLQGLVAARIVAIPSAPNSN